MQTYSLAERPDLTVQFWEIDNDWPPFMGEDPVAATRYPRAVELFPDLHLLALDGEQPVARVHAVPISWPGLDGLPDRGWDWALESAVDHPTDERKAVCLIERGTSRYCAARPGPQPSSFGRGTRKNAEAGNHRPCGSRAPQRQSARTMDACRGVRIAAASRRFARRPVVARARKAGWPDRAGGPAVDDNSGNVVAVAAMDRNGLGRRRSGRRAWRVDAGLH